MVSPSTMYYKLQNDSIDIYDHVGFEGLTVSEDGKSLWVLLQAAAVQEGVSRNAPSNILRWTVEFSLRLGKTVSSN